MTLLSGLVALAISYLLVAYAIGGPVLLARRLYASVSRRRLRYRPAQDDVLASSRFTIPVSVILCTEGDVEAADATAHLLALNYPEFEVIVVNDGSRDALAALRERFALSACEIFYRRSLQTGPVRAIYRSATEPRLLVLDCATETRGDAFNCGVNLARYRYVCCTDGRARYRVDALLDSMHAAVEDPALVVGVTTVLTPPAGSSAADDPAVRASAWSALDTLTASRALMTRTSHRRLNVADGLPGWTLWRRDALIEVGGFGRDGETEQVELAFRMHRHHLRQARPYRIVHVSEGIGVPASDRRFRELRHRQRVQQEATAALLWRYRGLLLNPRYGSVGTVDLPRYVFSTLVVPWLELLCLGLLPLAPMLGLLTISQVLLLLVALGLGNAILLNTALLMGPPGAHDDMTMRRFVLLGPIELFVSRPVQLYARLRGVLRMFGRATPATGA
jgi:cellulose synthase/poly-beta-1,6-N-acetylglucosamine synthase-like glycosyltransferase